MTTNRNPIKHYFVTFPQSGQITRNQFFDVLNFKPLDYYLVALESHADGNPHMHAVLAYKKGVTRAQFLKQLKLQYPEDYKRIKIESWRTLKTDYLRKEDETPLEGGKLPGKTLKYNKRDITFAQEQGYESVDEMVAAYRSEKSQRLEMYTEFMRLYIDVVRQNYFYIPHKIFRLQKSFDDFFLQNIISEDDIATSIEWLKEHHFDD